MLNIPKLSLINIIINGPPGVDWNLANYPLQVVDIDTGYKV